MDAAGDAPVVQAPDGLQLGPRGGDVDRHEGGEVEAVRGLATMQDEIALQGAGCHPRPFAPGAQRHLGAEGAEGRGEAPRVPGAPLPQRAQQAIGRRRAGGGEGHAQGRGHHDAMMLLQGRQEAGQDRDEHLAGQIVAGAPHALEERQELTAVAPPASGGPPGAVWSRASTSTPTRLPGR